MNGIEMQPKENRNAARSSELRSESKCKAV